MAATTVYRRIGDARLALVGCGHSISLTLRSPPTIFSPRCYRRSMRVEVRGCQMVDQRAHRLGEKEPCPGCVATGASLADNVKR